MSSLARDFIIENGDDSSNSSTTVTPINLQLSDSLTVGQDTCNDESSCTAFSVISNSSASIAL